MGVKGFNLPYLAYSPGSWTQKQTLGLQPVISLYHMLDGG